MTITTRTRSFQVSISTSYHNEYNPDTGNTRLVCDLPSTPDGLTKQTYAQARAEIAEARRYAGGSDYGVRVWVNGKRVDGFQHIMGLDHLNEILGN